MNREPLSTPRTPRTPRALVGLLLATRLARREVRHRPGRTALVALLVAIPVMGMLVADVMVRTNRETPLQQWRSLYGMADALAIPNPGLAIANVTTASSATPSTATPTAATASSATPSTAIPSAAVSKPMTELLAKSKIFVGRNYVGGGLFRTADGLRSNVDVAIMPMTDPLTRGIVQLTAGRPPRGGHEAFLTRAAAHDLHVRVGDTLHLVRPKRAVLVVTGTGEFADGWGHAGIVLPPNTSYPWKSISQGSVGGPLLLDIPSSIPRAELKRLRDAPSSGWTLEVSPALLTPKFPDDAAQNTETAVHWSWVIGALVLTVAGIVIAAAFAAGARRQLVTLGQLAANGAPPKLLRKVLFLQGTWTGVLGALGGFVLGGGALALLAPHVDRIFKKDVHPYSVRPSDLIPIFVLGVVTATIGALLPARTSSRIPVLAALSGRRPLGKVPRWLPISGVCVATGGLGLFGLAVIGANGHSTRVGSGQVWAYTAIIGGVAVLLGACTVAPAYVSILEPAARRSRGSARIAIRSLARQRTRTGAVVSAIAATGALAIGASALVLAFDQHDRAQLPYTRADEVQLSGYPVNESSLAPPASVVDKAQRVLKQATRFQLVSARKVNVSWQIRDAVANHPDDVAVGNAGGVDALPTGETVDIGVANRSLLNEYGLSASARRQLRLRGALYLGPADGHVFVASIPSSPDGTTATSIAPGTPVAPTRTFEAAMIGGRFVTGLLPRLLVTATKAQHLGLTQRPSVVVLRTPKALTKDQLNAIRDLSFDSQSVDDGFNGKGVDRNYVSFFFYSPSNRISPLLIEWALVGIALVLVLFVVAVNLALSASETRDERDVLTIAGASPRAMRQASGYKAALLTVMGALLALPVGFLPVAVFVANDSQRLPLVFPWPVVALLAIGLPVVAGLVTTVGSALALYVRPVRVSTMAYD